MEFEKYHGNGNDFIFLSCAVFSNFHTVNDFRAFVRDLCNRTKGVGADGVVVYDHTVSSLLIVNSDGSFAASCGNALRCFGLMLMQKSLWNGLSECLVGRLVPPFMDQSSVQPGEEFMFEQEDFATLLNGSLALQSVSVGMAQEKSTQLFQVKHCPVPQVTQGVFVQLSNPHLVFLNDAFATLPTEGLISFGKWAQNELIDPQNFPFPVSNINMVFLNKECWQLVVFERGAGLTQCCGTGAVATRIALEMLDKINPREPQVSFNLPGGSVDISSTMPHSRFQRSLSGPAQYVFQGKMSRI